jgi:hypothetical protein
MARRLQPDLALWARDGGALMERQLPVDGPFRLLEEASYRHQICALPWSKRVTDGPAGLHTHRHARESTFNALFSAESSDERAGQVPEAM